MTMPKPPNPAKPDPVKLSEELNRTAEELLRDLKVSRERAQATAKRMKLLAEQVRQHLSKTRGEP